MNDSLSSFRYYFAPGIFLLVCLVSYSQDSSLIIANKVITLKEVVVRNNLNVPGFIERVQKDTSFYKAFKNLRVLSFTALNDIRMLNRKGTVKAMLQSKTRQSVANGCRSMQVINETTTGDIYDDNRNWNYYTAEIYAGLFFTRSTVCNENNIVGNNAISLKGKTGVQKHKEQLKMLLFNPGSRVPGIPFIGNKVAIFDDKTSHLYDYIIDMDNYQGQNCYLFIVRAREDLSRTDKNDVVINNLTTWFDSQTMEIVARKYELSYDAGVFDFAVNMQVELTRYRHLLVPRLIRYSGNWHAILKKRETGIFTATMFDFGTNL